MEDNYLNQSSYFKDTISCGIKGDYNEIKFLKVYLEKNPHLRLYITEREIPQERSVGQKRKVEVAKYLEIRDQEGDKEKIIIQIKLENDEVSPNYPILIASKEVKEVKEVKEAQEENVQQIVEFKSVCQLKSMKKLERGCIKVIMKETEKKGFDETGYDNQSVIIPRVYTQEDILPPKPENQTDDEKNKPVQSKEDIYVTNNNEQWVKKQLISKIKQLESNNVDTTYACIQAEINIRPEKTFKSMLDELCYQEKKNSKNIYKLKQGI
ncbi:hypothetical protein TTHERM_00139630 (macronuclear) [Tetrahymena thermophila SB210]|uniref:Uncharacterized protein n=1 Tax=Tetrahymena thermophila (strain SB210) TaxID=312017 RepID=I7LVS0_TETTS|nr:hypothetical protein TTHERM_00139630 [Tetrahymena thermophila SB210]EAR99601.1 hypothetical protein TTHERM_00139630 [Tetrahymena thermophila SB210]|eukprot:XP_001019846.1 hypothetical protein TTHERM_00139630 [Tetrahymena thermophila SB210]